MAGKLMQDLWSNIHFLIILAAPKLCPSIGRKPDDRMKKNNYIFLFKNNMQYYLYQNALKTLNKILSTYNPIFKPSAKKKHYITQN